MTEANWLPVELSPLFNSPRTGSRLGPLVLATPPSHPRWTAEFWPGEPQACFSLDHMLVLNVSLLEGQNEDLGLLGIHYFAGGTSFQFCRKVIAPFPNISQANQDQRELAGLNYVVSGPLYALKKYGSQRRFVY